MISFTIEKWVKVTALGRPVVPDVKKIHAGLSQSSKFCRAVTSSIVLDSGIW
jgi:hypothetical protein